MNIQITTKALNESRKLFFLVRPEDYDLLRWAALNTAKTGVVKMGYNYGVYGWNYTVYVMVKKIGVYYIVRGQYNLPKRLVKWTREDLENALAAE